MAEVRVRVTGDTSGFNAALTKSRVMAQAFAGRMRSITSGIGSSLVGMFGAAAVGAAVRRTIQWADQLNDTSQRLDVNVEKLQAWEYAAVQTGAGLEKLTTTIEKLKKSQADAARGLSTAKLGLAAFGITGADDVETMLSKLSQKVRSGNFSTGQLMDIGGRGATSLIPALKQWEELAAAAEQAGVIIKAEQIAVLEKLNDQFTFMGRFIMATLAPAIQWAAEKFIYLTHSIKAVGSFIGTLASEFSPSKLGEVLVAQVRASFRVMMAAIGAVIAETPIGKALKAVGVDLPNFADVGKAAAQGLQEVATAADKVWGGDGLVSKFGDAVTAAGQEMVKADNMIAGLRTPAAVSGVTPSASELFKASKPTKSDVDSLAKVGLFTQSGLNAGPVLDIQRRMLAVQQKIERNTDPANNSDGDEFA